MTQRRVLPSRDRSQVPGTPSMVGGRVSTKPEGGLTAAGVSERPGAAGGSAGVGAGVAAGGAVGVEGVVGVEGAWGAP